MAESEAQERKKERKWSEKRASRNIKLERLEMGVTENNMKLMGSGTAWLEGRLKH